MKKHPGRDFRAKTAFGAERAMIELLREFDRSLPRRGQEKSAGDFVCHNS